MKNSFQEKILELEEIDIDELLDDYKSLVVYNGDVNTFEHVIETLIRVCKHDPQQAEQCTWIIHYRGKCKVKEGSYDDLKPMKEAICEVGINAKIH